MTIVVDEHIHLSEIGPADKTALVEHLQDYEIYRWTLRIPQPYTEADADTWLARAEKAERDRGPFIAWAIRNEADFLIGGCGLDGLEDGKAHSVQLGYWLASSYHGRGIMTAVVAKVCDHAFNNLGVVRIFAHVFPGNDASARVLEKCGFQEEGYLRKAVLKDGNSIDVRLFALVS
jgi:[ribosomal protein S5]-alanine N-acetyltransferase